MFSQSHWHADAVPGWSSLHTARLSDTCSTLCSAQALRLCAKAEDSECLTAICSRWGSTWADITEGSANTLAWSCSYKLKHLNKRGRRVKQHPVNTAVGYCVLMQQGGDVPLLWGLCQHTSEVRLRQVTQQHLQCAGSIGAFLQQQLQQERHGLVHLHDVHSPLALSSSHMVQHGAETSCFQSHLLVLVLQQVKACVDQPKQERECNNNYIIPFIYIDFLKILKI